MSYRDELLAARARIEVLEEELAEARAPDREARGAMYAPQRLLAVLRTERHRQLGEIDERVARLRHLTPFAFLVGVGGAVAWSLLRLDRSTTYATVMALTLGGFSAGILFALSPLLLRGQRQAIERRFRLRIAEAEAQAELAVAQRQRIATAPTAERPREIEDASDDIEIDPITGLDQHRARR